MRKVNEITVFTYGDSSKINTWSNVPYFFTTTLEKKGLKVNRVDIGPSSYRLIKLFNLGVVRFLNKIDSKNTYIYIRSFLFRLEANVKIFKSVLKYKNTDVFLFLNFDFSTKLYSRKPSLLFGDWTYEHYLKYHVGKKPNFFENLYIKSQNRKINTSNLVVPLFPKMATELSLTHRGNIKYLGNVINTLVIPDKDALLALKLNSKSLLFVGSVKYIEGAKMLLDAFKELTLKYSKLTLDFIGLNENDFGEIDLPKGVRCHGYLDKQISEQKALYYDLLSKAKVFVNTTPKWSSFSASVEAMYFYTPLIVPPYEEFVETFGNDFQGGVYCRQEDSLSDKIELILNLEFYEQMCVTSQKMVENFTWDYYVNCFLEEAETL